MGVVMDLSDRVVVLEYGMNIADGTPDEVKKNQKVIDAIWALRIEWGGHVIFCFKIFIDPFHKWAPCPTCWSRRSGKPGFRRALCADRAGFRS